MVQEVLRLERDEKFEKDSCFIKSWCVLPDETLVYVFFYNKTHTVTRWDAKENKIRMKSEVLETAYFDRNFSRIFPLSNHRVLLIYSNVQKQILVREWDYEKNVLSTQTKCIANDIRRIQSVNVLENDRILFKFPRGFTMYDANDETSFEIELIDHGVDIMDYCDCFFLEEKDGDWLSFMTEHGNYLEVRSKPMSFFQPRTTQDLNTNRERSGEENECEDFYVKRNPSKDIAIELISYLRGLNKTSNKLATQPAPQMSIISFFPEVEIVAMSSIQILSNGDLLLMDKAKHMVCVDRTKNPVVWTNYEMDKIGDCGVYRLMELRSGLIMGYSIDHSVVFVWNRKGKLLRKEYLGSFDRIVESDSGSLIYIQDNTTLVSLDTFYSKTTLWIPCFAKLNPIYSETNLVTRCCNSLAQFIHEKAPNATKDEDHDKGIRVRNAYFHYIRTILPLDLCKLIVSFLGARSNAE